MASVRTGGDSRIEVAGDLLFDDAVAVRDAGRALIRTATAPVITVSLAGVGRVNSVSVAVLVEWQRIAAAGGRTLAVVDVPARLAGILRLSGLDEVLVLA